MNCRRESRVQVQERDALPRYRQNRAETECAAVPNSSYASAGAWITEDRVQEIIVFRRRREVAQFDSRRQRRCQPFREQSPHLRVIGRSVFADPQLTWLVGAEKQLLYQRVSPKIE